jgi:hypothetical protein
MLQTTKKVEKMKSVFINWLPRLLETFKFAARVLGLSA